MIFETRRFKHPESRMVSKEPPKPQAFRRRVVDVAMGTEGVMDILHPDDRRIVEQRYNLTAPASPTEIAKRMQDLELTPKQVSSRELASVNRLREELRTRGVYFGITMDMWPRSRN
jgi:hypothetical protein